VAVPAGEPAGPGRPDDADQHAEINIEINEICAAIGPVLDRGTYPVRYILATGGNLGGGEEEMEQMRASLEPVLARNPNLKVSAKVASNHSHIVRKDFRAIAEAVREASVAARDHEVR
jgi:hypothetical protein